MQLNVYTGERLRVNEFPECFGIEHFFDNYCGEILICDFQPACIKRNSQHKPRIQIRKKAEYYAIFMIEYGSEEMHWGDEGSGLYWWKDSEVVMEF